jgi:phosphohistidine phosphatase SixA
MKIVALRHATRQRDSNPIRDEYLEKELLLCPTGEEESKKRGLELDKRGIKPAVYFTSCFAHARQTGEILRDSVGKISPAKVVALCTLTPHFQGPRQWRGNWQGIRILESVIEESELMVKEVGDLEAIAFVLHQPRLKQLLAVMTSQAESRFEDIGYSNGTVLTVDSLRALLQGKGIEDGARLE